MATDLPFQTFLFIVIFGNAIIIDKICSVRCSDEQQLVIEGRIPTPLRGGGCILVRYNRDAAFGWRETARLRHRIRTVPPGSRACELVACFDLQVPQPGGKVV